LVLLLSYSTVYTYHCGRNWEENVLGIRSDITSSILPKHELPTHMKKMLRTDSNI
jgi:hypothetical protein